MTSYARGRTLSVLIGVAALVGAANLGAYAASGQPLLLGHQNHARATTTLTTGKVPALTLRTSRKTSPLAVSSSKVVKHLNADRVDGRKAADLGARAIVYRLPDGPTQQALELPPPGTYLVSISAMLSDGNPGVCWVEADGKHNVEPISINGVVQGAYNTVTGSAVFTLTRGVQYLDFRCLSPIYSTALNPSTVALVRLSAHQKGKVLGRR